MPFDEDPLPVPSSRSSAAQVGDLNTAPTTTAAEDATKLGQRRINLIWERTQAVIAVTVCVVTMFIVATICLRGGEAAQTAFQLLANLCFLIVGTYFQRTNHQQIGGVGPKDLGR